VKKKKSSGIYQIRNVANGKIYIGSTTDFKDRFGRHKTMLRTNKHHSQYLQRSWNKYKGQGFLFEILEYIDNPNLNLLHIREQLWIDFKSPEYNMGSVAGGFDFENHPKGPELLKIAKARLIEYNKSDVARAKAKARCGEKNNFWKGGISKPKCLHCSKIISWGCKQCASCMSQFPPFKGKNHSEETKEKLSKSRKGRSVPWRVKRVEINGIEYPSISAAARALNLHNETVRLRLHKSYPGYKFI
jgi:group I intron endonuclease